MQNRQKILKKTSMNDLMPFEHGEEGTHYSCRAQSEKYGSSVRCCGCSEHDCESDLANFCGDRDCPLFVVGGTHRKGITNCKYV